MSTSTPRRPRTRKVWTPQNKDLLEKHVFYLKDRGFATAAEVLGCEESECRKEFQKYFSEEPKKQPWTKTEDSIILEFANEHQMPWDYIAELLPNRTPISVYTRYNYLTAQADKSPPPKTQTSAAQPAGSLAMSSRPKSPVIPEVSTPCKGDTLEYTYQDNAEFYWD